MACTSFIGAETHCSSAQPRPAAPQPRSCSDRAEKLLVKSSEASALRNKRLLAAKQPAARARRAPRSLRTPRDGVWGPDSARQPRHRAPCSLGEARLMPRQHRLCLSPRREEVEIHRQRALWRQQAALKATALRNTLVAEGCSTPSGYHGLSTPATPRRCSRMKPLPKHPFLNLLCSLSPLGPRPCSAPQQMTPLTAAAELVLQQDPAAKTWISPCTGAAWRGAGTKPGRRAWSCSSSARVSKGKLRLP